MLRNILVITFLSLSALSFGQTSSYQIGVLKYNGGGDWYANPTAVPNLVKFCNQNLGTRINENVAEVNVGSSDISSYPILHMTGHGNVVFSTDEIANLRKYLINGGFLHIDDNYGMDEHVRREMQRVFPELEFVELPASHKIYHQKYDFKGLPKIHEHDNKPAQGFGLIYEGRLICYYSYETDLGDGWEDQEVHKDSDAARQKALKMGANIIQFAMSGGY